MPNVAPNVAADSLPVLHPWLGIDVKALLVLAKHLVNDGRCFPCSTHLRTQAAQHLVLPHFSHCSVIDKPYTFLYHKKTTGKAQKCLANKPGPIQEFTRSQASGCASEFCKISGTAGIPAGLRAGSSAVLQKSDDHPKHARSGKLLSLLGGSLFCYIN